MSARAAWGLVLILAFCNALSFVDRQLIVLLTEPIRKDLGLSDTQLGLLQGTVFAFTYAFLAIPCATLSDRTVRTRVVGAGVLLWSAMTGFAGFARNFTMLAISRFGIAVGEATLNPATFSMLSDVFPPKKLALPLSLYAAGTVTGSAMAFLGGAALYKYVQEMGGFTLFGYQHPAWQAVFLAVGLLGIAVAPILFFIREPARRVVAQDKERVDFAEPFRFIWQERATTIPLFLGFGFNGMAANAINSWISSMLQRTHGFTVTEAGTAIGLVYLISGVSGNAFFGWLSDTLEQRGVNSAKLRVAAASLVLGSCANIYGPLSPTGTTAVGAFAVTIFAAGGVAGTISAALQTMTPNRLRATVSATYLFCFNIIGLGLGPVTVALVSDYIFGGGGTNLRYAIVTVAGLAGPLAAMLLYIASRRIKVLAT